MKKLICLVIVFSVFVSAIAAQVVLDDIDDSYSTRSEKHTINSFMLYLPIELDTNNSLSISSFDKTKMDIGILYNGKTISSNIGTVAWSLGLSSPLDRTTTEKSTYNMILNLQGGISYLFYLIKIGSSHLALGPSVSLKVGLKQPKLGGDMLTKLALGIGGDIQYDIFLGGKVGMSFGVSFLYNAFHMDMQGGTNKKLSPYTSLTPYIGIAIKKARA